MKNVLLSVLLLCVVVFSAQAQLYSNADIKHHNIVSINRYPINGYLEHLPPGYNSNPTKKYPMIVFLHGQGEKGDGNIKLYLAAKFGPSIEVEKNGKLCATVNGVEECFIVISPQTSADWSAGSQRQFWDYILNGPKNYRYDPERIYLTGLSLGGGGVWNWAQSGDPLSKRIAAMAPIAGWGAPNLACNVADAQISVWGFHGTADGTISYSWGKSAYDALLQCNNVGNRDRKWSAIQGGSHFIWNQIYPTNGGNFTNPTLYQWFLSQTKTQTNNPNNQPPTVSVSGPGTLTLPTNFTTITATASDPDGQIYNYTWRKVSGPSASLSNTDKNKLTVTNMVQGTYTFEISVMDNDGATAKATATVVVNGGAVANQGPTVNAGADRTVDEGANVVMAASASDADGWIAQYAWTKISGPAVTLQNQNKLNMTMVAPQPGTYEFQLKVTDDDGATAQDRVIITVKQVTPPTGTFTVSAGSDFTWDLNEKGSEFFVIVNFDIPGGWPSKIEWKKVSGPAATLSQTDKARLIVSNVTAGAYEFEVTITDNLGRTGTDRVVVTVTGSSSTTPPANGMTVSAGSDITWNLDEQGNEFFLIVNFDIPGGWPTKIEWTKVSGPAAILSQTDKARLIVTNFGPGTYEFEVTITDNLGQTGSDRVIVTVVGSGSTNPPSGISVSAGDDFDWDLARGQFSIIANFNIPDGWPEEILWTKVSGPAATLSQTNKARLVVDNATVGTYEFQIWVRDNKGRTATDRVRVNVSGSSSSSGFTVSAGADIEWDVNRGDFFLLVTLNMTEGWPDNIKWQKISGPAATLSQTDKAKMIVSNPSVGNYQFRVTVTDNMGRVASDDVNVIVYNGLVTTMASSDDLTNEIQVQNQTVIKNFSTSSDYLTIVENADMAMKIQVININGTSREMLEFDGQMNLARLQSGMYIYQVITEEGFVLQKGRIVKY
ncbi:PKD domain-containing protein [Fulvivirga sedimenti]|uniref:PKD/Chitinase domain-containing protein n=1 Tax=Fulvivirga sedimenti TaxID=2879465 RepID=A0A9X1HQC1_9BACT|nr:PKD domain-containing protein [Fulvivirga sedimenti]MCA6074287.1 hypothetical protein [Fulvivirga sedimenti]